jgi:polysaccharide biosynthesis/export protein
MTRKSSIQPLGRIAVLVVAGLLAYTTGTFAITMLQAPSANSGKAPAANASAPSNYILGPNDEFSVYAPYAEDLSGKSYRVSPAGEVNLPKVGRIHAAGMSVSDLEAEVTEGLKAYIKQPDVVINITQFKGQPATVFGEVGNPGVVQLEGRKTLIEVLTLAGGLRPTAGSRIKITREISSAGLIPLASARIEGDYSMAEVNVSTIADRPSDNILILPKDYISVTKADIVYVTGEVHQPGGFVLNDRKSISVIDVLARAGGTGATAKRKDAVIYRQVSGEDLKTIPINIDDIYKIKALNVMLQPDDILYVPDSYAKGQARRTFENVLQMAIGVAIFH